MDNNQKTNDRLDAAKKSYEEMKKEFAQFSSSNKLIFITGKGVWLDIGTNSVSFL